VFIRRLSYAAAEMDYRLSHLQKGRDYDEDLSRGDLETYMTERERDIVVRVVRESFPDGIPRYLDFACGTGRITQHVAPLARESYGIDVSATMQAEARRKCPRTTFITADLTRDQLDLPPFNVVTAFRFFAGAQDELRRAALAAIRNTLAERGLLIINSHLNPRSIHNRMQRLRGIAVEEGIPLPGMRRLLLASGFDIVRVYGIALWMMRYRWNTPRVMRSRVVRLLEPLSDLPGMATLCPDAVIVARKR
jgi:SAM-dependent methyltransferase